MPFERPALATIRSRVQADLDSRLPGADARLRRSNTNVLAIVESALAHGLYGYLSWIAGQVMADTAEAEFLARHASIWGVARKEAAAATGPITVTGVSGSVVPAGTVYQRSDGAEFETAADAELVNGAASITVTAIEAGAAGNTDAGVQITLVSSIEGVNGNAAVGEAGLTSGADQESDDALRARLLARIQEPPHGGADFDYVAWALEVSGVTRAWCYPAYLGLGTVGLTFVCDQAGSIIPATEKVAEVQAYIDALRPVTADVTVFAPVALPVDCTIHLAPDTSATRAAVQAEMADLFAREGEPAARIYLSHLHEAISIATGETDHVLSIPAADVVCGNGAIPVLGTITWV